MPFRGHRLPPEGIELLVKRLERMFGSEAVDQRGEVSIHISIHKGQNTTIKC